MTGRLEMAERVAVLLPCLNEEDTVAQVVADFRASLPGAVIYVIDNGSTDRTAETAAAAGAVVFHVPERGKGNAVRRMFRAVEADTYVIADGDAEYAAAYAPEMIARLHKENLDMVVAARDAPKQDFRRGHYLGNRLFNRAVALLFGKRFTDVFSGYRVLSRRLVKSFPAFSKGFEIETELTIHVLELRLPAAEIKAPYKHRPTGSSSKLKSVRHGLMLWMKIVTLFAQVRPFTFFSVIASVLFAFGVAFGYPVIVVFLETSTVPYLPRAVLAASLMILASLSLVCGLILHHLSQVRRETRYMHYLQAGGGNLPPEKEPTGS